MTEFIPVILVVVVGLVAGIILTIASKLFYVPVDETVAQLIEALPGANCGACGYAGCEDYANAMGEDRSLSISLCPVGGASCIEALGEILGVEGKAADPIVAWVKCKGSNDKTSKIMEYQGIQTCEAAATFFGGSGACQYGCMGIGDCVRSCDFDAIHIIDGVAVVDREKCVGCGACEKACPKDIIMMGPKKKTVYVGCSSKAAAAKARKACSVACIGCRKCFQVCKFDAIVVENNLAYIDLDKCKNCQQCVAVCPTEAIKTYRVRKTPAKKPAPPKPAPAKPVENNAGTNPANPQNTASKPAEVAKPETAKPVEPAKTETVKPVEVVKPVEKPVEEKEERA